MDSETSEKKFSWRPALTPVLALGLSWLFWAVFALEKFDSYGPGAGVPLFVAAYFGCVLLLLGKKAHWTWAGAISMAGELVLGLCCSLYALPGILIINSYLILFLAALSTFCLSGQLQKAPWLLTGAIQAIGLSFQALFTRIERTFQVSQNWGQKDSKGLGRLALALVAALPVVMLVLWLLSSADAVFASFFQGWAEYLARSGLWTVAWKVLRVVVLALFVASGLYFIREEPPTTAAEISPRTPKSAMPMLVLSVLLNIVYLLFCGVQLRYLFGGQEAASMAGGWASYAREGFFQLAAVAALNLGLTLLAAGNPRPTPAGALALGLAQGLMLVLTLVILASALRRMELYIAAFGLSVLRLMTLWAMGMIFIGLCAAGWKLIRPGFSFGKWMAPLVLAAWCMLCLCSPGGLVAHYNVNAYLDGRLDTVDVDYLEQLSTDALPALYTLQSQAPDTPELENTLLHLTGAALDTTHWTNWKLSIQWAKGR
jgi:hypothetical protein